ncbi:LOW QUALITY PROTEIN: hypothetical protein U9M48_015504 [Paspalum notatum var. saurae]|uniref:Uncharacterized protein n=1 Tax=Paspalum notatum var. saurae TaxID=547442 RepID=A0AAQ3T6P7_PASNO
MPDTLAASLTLHPTKALLASSRILSPCRISLLEYHVRKNLPCSVPPSAAKNPVSSGVSLMPPASSGSPHSGCPASAAAALKSASRAEADLDVHEEAGVQEVRHVLPEALHEVGVHLDGRPAVEQRLVIDADGEALLVPRPAGAGVEHVGVALADLPHPPRDRDADGGVADVAAAGVERHDGLQLQVLGLHGPEQLPVRAPLVARRPRALHDAPPHVHHHAVHARAPQPPQLRPQRLRVRHLVLRRHHLQLHPWRTTKELDSERDMLGPLSFWKYLNQLAYRQHDVDRDVAAEHRLLLVAERWWRLPKSNTIGEH